MEYGIQDEDDPNKYWDPDYYLEPYNEDDQEEEVEEEEHEPPTETPYVEPSSHEGLTEDGHVGRCQFSSLQVKPVRNVVVRQTTSKQIWTYVDQLLQDTSTEIQGTDVLWDSGATHALLPGSQLRLIPEKDRYSGKLAYMGLAAGRKHKGCILGNLVFTTGVPECILPAGRVTQVLGLSACHTPEKVLLLVPGTGNTPTGPLLYQT